MMDIPLYYQIYRDLQYKICEGIYKPGSCLPRESDLEKIYGTSRAPVRQALGALENDGLVVRRQGKGTFVCGQVRSSPWLIATGFLKNYERFWERLSVKTLVISSRVPKNHNIIQFLQLKAGQETTYLIRLQYIDNKPAILLESYFSPRYSPQIFKDAGNFMSLKELLLSKFGTTIRHTHEKLAVRIPVPQFTQWLNVPENTPVLRVRRFMYDKQDKPVLVSNQYVFTDEWEYEADFTLKY